MKNNIAHGISAPCIVFIIVFIVFIPSLFNSFVDWDDSPLILFNYDFRGLAWENIKWMFTTFHMSHYQPLSWLSLAIDYSVWGLNPIGYHLTNVLLHSAAAAMVFKSAYMLLKHEKTSEMAAMIGAAFAALFFAVHPLRAESVSWITERRDVLSACLFTLSLLLYLRNTCKDSPINSDNSGTCLFPKRLIPCLIAYIAACFSKSMAVTLPAVLLMLDFYPLRRISFSSIKENKNVIIEKIPFFTFAAGLSLFYYFVVGKAIDIPYVSEYMPSAAKAIYAYWFYILKTFIPINLSPVYVAPENGYFIPNLIGGIFLATLATAAFLYRRKKPFIITGLLFYAGTLFPACGLLNGAPVPAADRYSYIPSIGIAVILGAILSHIIEKPELKKKAMIISAAIITALSVAGIRQQTVWKSSTPVWNRVLEIEPNSSIAYNNLASLAYAKGDPEKAEQLMLKAITLAPTDFNIIFNCANLYAMKGESEKAIGKYQETLDLAPEYYEAYIRKANLEMQSGNNEKAEKTLLAAAEKRPQYADAWQGIAMIRLQSKNYAGAEDVLQKINTKDQTAETMLMLAEATAGQGRYEEASELCRKILRLYPDHQQAAMFLKQLEAAISH